MKVTLPPIGTYFKTFMKAKTLSFMNKLDIPMMEEGKIMVNVRNFCTPFHMKILSFRGGTTM